MACFSQWDIGGCGCASGSCTQTFTILGCSALPYPGVTVSVYTSAGGTLLASGATNGSGQVALSWSGVTGNYYVTVTGQSPRFAAYGQTIRLTCGASAAITLTPAANYYCFSGCLLPLPATLNLTDGANPRTMTYNAAGPYWQELTFYGAHLSANGQYKGPTGGCTSPFGGSLTVTINSCPPSFMATVPTAVPPATCPTNYTITE